MNYRAWSIRGKLLAGFALVVMVLVAQGTVSSFLTERTLKIYEEIVQDNVPSLVIFIRMQAAQKSMVIPVAMLVGNNSNAAETARAKQEVDKYLAIWNDSSKQYESTPFAPGEEAAWKSFQNNHWKPFLIDMEEMLRLSATGEKADQVKRDRMWEGDFAKRRSDLNDAFETLMKYQLDETNIRANNGDRSAHVLNGMLLLAIVLGAGLSMLLGWMISGQLSTELSQVSGSLGRGADELTGAVSMLAGASQALASASNQQAASLQQTAAAIEEITQMVQRATDSARESAQTSDESRQNAEHGQQVVQQMISSMEQIDRSNQRILTQINEGNQRVSELVTVIQQIASKTKVINDIVFQTKLLSFNASVEAARAGEHGKGFAVVAEEVGNLAQMSGNAAKEISRLLEESVARVQTVVQDTKGKVEELMTVGRTTVEQGNHVAQQCGKVLADIVRNVSRVSAAIQAISTASSEQARGVEEVNRAIQELEKVTQTNSAAAAQSAGAAEQISQQSQLLRGSARGLRMVIAGGNSEAAVVAMEPKKAPPAPPKLRRAA